MNSRKDAKLTLELKRETIDSWVFLATITEEEKKYELTITLNKNYYKELTSGKILPLVLVQESIFFLLEKEPAGSILREFDLRQISDHFPQYESNIKQDLGIS